MLGWSRVVMMSFLGPDGKTHFTEPLKSATWVYIHEAAKIGLASLS